MNEELVRLYIEWIAADEFSSVLGPWEKINSITKDGIILDSKEYEKAEDLLEKIKNSVLFKALNE